MVEYGELINKEELIKVREELNLERKNYEEIARKLEETREENRKLRELASGQECFILEMKDLIASAKKKILELKDLQYKTEDKIGSLNEEIKLLSALLYLSTGGNSVPLTKQNMKTIVRAMREEIALDIDTGDEPRIKFEKEKES